MTFGARIATDFSSGWPCSPFVAHPLFSILMSSVGHSSRFLENDRMNDVDVMVNDVPSQSWDNSSESINLDDYVIKNEENIRKPQVTRLEFQTGAL